METNKKLQINNLFKKLCLVFCYVLVFNLIAFGHIASAISNVDRKAILNNRPWYKMESNNCTVASDTGQPVPINGSSVYVLGDSITDGVRNSYIQAFKSAGASNVVVNAAVGRNLSSPGTSGDVGSGYSAITKDSEIIKNSNIVIIALGSNQIDNINDSNPDNYVKKSIDSITKAVGQINGTGFKGKIFWVDVAVSASGPSTYPSLSSQINRAIHGGSAQNNYSVINWSKAVDPNYNNTSPSGPVADAQKLLSDGLHPNSAGQSKLVETAVSSITNIAPSSTNTPKSNCVCSVGVATQLAGSDNPEKVWNFFAKKGLSPEQIAGIMGNMSQESGFDPENIQDPQGTTKDPTTVTKAGWGLIQWTPGIKIINIAKQANITTPIYELSTQLDIVWWHMNNTSPTGVKNMLEKYKQITDTAEATRDFEKRMEGAGKPAIEKRIRFANDFLNKYKGSSNSSVVTTSSGSSSLGCSSTQPGQPTKFVDGFAIYNQYDSQWKDKPYSTSTIGDSGCGPSAMAMIITALTGQTVTPIETANYAASQNMYVPGSGSSWLIGEVVAKNWNLRATPLKRSVPEITAALQAGGLVITPGKGTLPFTKRGHFIVIRGVTASGKWKVGDSGHNDTSDKDWDPEEIIANMRDGGIYNITK